MAALVAAKRMPAWVLADRVSVGAGGNLVRAVVDGANPVAARNGDKVGAFSLASANEHGPFISFYSRRPQGG